MLHKTVPAIIVVCSLAVLVFCWASDLPAEPIAPGSLDSPAEQTQRQQMPEITEAARFFNMRDYQGALEQLREAVKKDPALPPPNIIMAQFFAQAKNMAGVRSALEQSVIDVPDDPQAYLILGDLALRERRITEARLLFEKAEGLLSQWQGSAKRKESMMPQLYGGLAATAEIRGEWDKAQKLLVAWLELDYDNAAALQRLAQCQFRTDNVESALQSLRAAAKVNADMLLPEAILAQWSARSGDQQGAKKWLIDALTTAPKDAKVRLVASQWAWENGQLEEAEKQAEAALQLAPSYYSALNLRGVIALFRKDYAAAEKYFESAHLQAPTDVAASNNLALALVEQNDVEKRRLALHYAEANVRERPQSPEVYATYGWVLYKLGRLRDAEEALQKAVSGGKLTPETAYYLANVLADSGRGEDAIRFLQLALKTTAPFAQREDAQELLDQLQAASPLPQSQPPQQSQSQPQPQQPQDKPSQ